MAIVAKALISLSKRGVFCTNCDYCRLATYRGSDLIETLDYIMCTPFKTTSQRAIKTNVNTRMVKGNLATLYKTDDPKVLRRIYAICEKFSYAEFPDRLEVAQSILDQVERHDDGTAFPEYREKSNRFNGGGKSEVFTFLSPLF